MLRWYQDWFERYNTWVNENAWFFNVEIVFWYQYHGREKMHTHIDSTVLIVSFLYTVKQLFASVHEFKSFFCRCLMIIIHVYLFWFESIRQGPYCLIDNLKYWDDEESPLTWDW